MLIKKESNSIGLFSFIGKRKLHFFLLMLYNLYNFFFFLICFFIKNNVKLMTDFINDELLRNIT